MLLEDLTVVLGRGRRTARAVDGLDLDLGVGVHGLLGPNGAGKTTLMRVLATVITPTGGQVSLLGFDPRQAAERRELRRRLGYLPQSFGYYARFTVEEFVAYFAWLREVPASRSGVAVERAIARVGLADRAGSRMKDLSGGMLRRAGLAQAIVNDPELLLLDEPTAGLDPEQRLQFRTLLKEIGVDATVLVSTHLVEDVAAACTHVALMDEGHLVASGTPAGLAEAGRRTPDTGLDAGLDAGLDVDGVSMIERGYSAVLTAHRATGGRGPVMQLPAPAADGGAR